VLKTVGFVRRQVSATVAWQATTLIAVALLVGLPSGVALGRVVWRIAADQMGVVAEPAAPSMLFLAVPAAVLVANLIAAVPGWAAGRIRPAAVLRTE
jgi:predicted lysophospholipase L1 biosynthesis ABC-type transport system permease subunit